MGLTAIVLGAGASRRFGSAKQLLEFEGETLIHRAARTALSIAPTVVVIPDRNSGHVTAEISAAIREALSDLKVLIVENPGAGEGMASSIRAGVRACDGDLLITLGDQPRVTVAHFLALVQAGVAIAATSYDTIAGVPAFFSARFRPELLELRGDGGARPLFTRHADLLRTVSFAEAALDIDEPYDATDERRTQNAER